MVDKGEPIDDTVLFFLSLLLFPFYATPIPPLFHPRYHNCVTNASGCDSEVDGEGEGEGRRKISIGKEIRGWNRSSCTVDRNNLTFKYRRWKKYRQVWMIRVNVSGIQYHFVAILADFNYYHHVFYATKCGGTKERLFGYNSRYNTFEF